MKEYLIALNIFYAENKRTRSEQAKEFGLLTFKLGASRGGTVIRTSTGNVDRVVGTSP